MKLKAYSVFDEKADVWTQPFFQLNEATAQRVMANAVNSEGHNFNMNPEDYSLYCVGEWNDDTGVFTPLKEKKLDLITLVKPNPNMTLPLNAPATVDDPASKQTN